MTKITTKQLNVLESIYQLLQENGYPPTVREIGSRAGLSSPSTVHGHLDRLEERGFIDRDPSKTRTIEISHLGLKMLGIKPDKVPLLGYVAAGAPILAEEEAMDYYPKPIDLQYDPSELFMLIIKGESMINVGIMDGDMITVRKQSSANNGDIVVALTDENEATCKTFYRKSNHIILRPENDNMEDIILSNVSILGKVVSLTRYF
ncbi:transcriptional repressor LexA [Facklamia sp. DSM 111018]|uniref:LexA repressor n=1 Tax=Facklamia lactis TaxID=2749967 RepID=A0ABS0LNZ5_9LACT|nr:transcriptional repressor LexA [Facklamia lactis]MBG9980091.1 transcriptional repressor LexA [Facklamia lactis]MBG9985893.1 transcriptional repressor LexA [Facklamia lactis]